MNSKIDWEKVWEAEKAGLPCGTAALTLTTKELITREVESQLAETNGGTQEVEPPCPFCGSASRLHRGVVGPSRLVYYMSCSNCPACGAIGPYASSEDEARWLWRSAGHHRCPMLEAAVQAAANVEEHYTVAKAK